MPDPCPNPLNAPPRLPIPRHMAPQARRPGGEYAGLSPGRAGLLQGSFTWNGTPYSVDLVRGVMPRERPRRPCLLRRLRQRSCSGASHEDRTSVVPRETGARTLAWHHLHKSPGRSLVSRGSSLNRTATSPAIANSILPRSEERRVGKEGSCWLSKKRR